jgi:xylulokinase
MGYFLGVDIGTTTSKGALVTDEGRAVAVQVVAHPLSTPRPGWAEEDAERHWWGDVVKLCRGLLAESRVDPRDIVAVGVSSLGPSMVPIDADGRPLRPAILYGIDTRAAAEIAELTDLLAARGEPLRQRLTAQDIGPKLLWYRRREPDLWRQTRMVLGASGYVVWRLTGQPVVDDTCAMGYRPFFDEAGRGWRADRCALIDLDPAWLPPCRRPWEIAGTVTPPAAAETGLAVGTPVSAGVMDVLAEFLTGGATDPGDGVVTYGTTMCVLRVTGEPVDCPGLVGHFRTFTGQAALIGGMATSAALTRWFRDEFGAPELAAEAAGGPNAYAALAGAAAAIPPGSDGLVALPYFAGERTPIQDSRARGLVLGLTLAHTRAHVYRALLEGVAFALNHHLDLMRSAGVAIEEMVAIGGGARSPVWTQIVSDVCDMRQVVAAEVPGAALGAAFLAAKGVGLVDDWRTLRDRWIRIDRVVEPDPATVARYRDYYAVYRQLYPATREAMHKLAALAERS